LFPERSLPDGVYPTQPGASTTWASSGSGPSPATKAGEGRTLAATKPVMSVGEAPEPESSSELGTVPLPRGASRLPDNTRPGSPSGGKHQGGRRELGALPQAVPLPRSASRWPDDTRHGSRSVENIGAADGSLTVLPPWSALGRLIRAKRLHHAAWDSPTGRAARAGLAAESGARRVTTTS
jgi:hypothetical protein